jgi:Helix-turn-helix
MDKYIIWLRRGFDLPGKSKSGLAKHLGVAPSRISEIINGKRRLRLDELNSASSYFGLPKPSDDVLLSPQRIGGVTVTGRIEAGVWVDPTYTGNITGDQIAGLIDPRYPLSDQTARAIGTTAKDGTVKNGDHIIVVDLKTYRPNGLLPGDHFVFSENKNGLTRECLAKAVAKGNAVFGQSIIPDGNIEPLSTFRATHLVTAIQRSMT